MAEAAAVNVETLRYCENRGLISPPPRDAAGHRRYPPHTPTLLRMIKGPSAPASAWRRSGP